MKKVRYAIEAIGLWIMMVTFTLLPAKSASNLGGWIGKNIGPKLAASRKAKRHLNHALPEMKNTDDTIIQGMWENLGRVIAEYPHLKSIAQNNVTIEGSENLIALKGNKRSAIFFSAHSANWEIASASVQKHGLSIDPVYRAPNNPWADKMLNRFRGLKGTVTSYPKAKGTRDLVKAMKNGRNIGILIDQKYNEGISIPFFGTPAMTSPAFVQLAQKFNYALVPSYPVRHNGTEFTLHIDDELNLFDNNGNPRPIEDVMTEAHTYLEKRISETPSQWLWLHKRWGKNV